MNCRHRFRQFLVQSALFVLGELRWLKNCDEFGERSGKSERHLVFVLLQHRGSGVLSDIECFIEGKANPYGLRRLLEASQ